MRYIGNIVTNTKFKGNGLFNVVETVNDIDNGVPTLILGWEYTKKFYPDISIVDWKINDMIFWTFGKREKRDRQEEDIIKFTKMCVEKMLSSVEYKYSNVLILSKDEKEKLFKVISSDSKKTVYLDGDMLYFYPEGDEYVYGILMSDIDYEGANRNALLSKLHKYNGQFLNGIQSGITYEVREVLKGNKYIIPYMYS